MKRKHTLATGIALSLSLGIATAVLAQPGEKGTSEGQHAHGMHHGGMRTGMEHGTGEGPHAHGGTHHGTKGGSEHRGMQGHEQGSGHGPQLMTPEERTAFHEKMHNATPEERQKLVQTMRSEMHKRAQERGMAPHQRRGPRDGSASRAVPQASAAPEHTH